MKVIVDIGDYISEAFAVGTQSRDWRQAREL